jgi:hypothetical protein
MSKPALIALVLALGAAPALAAPPFKAPRNMYGQPDLSGNWSNATLTPETRSPGLGTRATFTEAEVEKLETQVTNEVEQGNASIDPNLGAPKVGGEIKAGTRPEYAAAAEGTKAERSGHERREQLLGSLNFSLDGVDSGVVTERDFVGERVIAYDVPFVPRALDQAARVLRLSHIGRLKKRLTAGRFNQGHRLRAALRRQVRHQYPRTLTRKGQRSRPPYP